MQNLQTLFEIAGFQKRAGANAATIARIESTFGVKLPEAFSELWMYSDGARGMQMELLPLVEIERYAGVFADGFGYVPFADCNQSNPYVVCTREPLAGMIVHVYHDNESVLICRTLQRFLELVAVEIQDHCDLDDIAGDFPY